MVTRRVRLLLAALLAVTLGVVAGCAADRARDAGPDSSQYLLPWAQGQTHGVIQGVQTSDPLTGACTSGCSTHRDDGMHDAWDFDLPEGAEILAARGGTVALMNGSWRPDHCGGLVPLDNAPMGYLVSPLMGNQANFVLIAHGDGTSGLYLHLSAVSPSIERKAVSGESVAQGEVLGLSGKTGLTQCEPHLHFQVEKSVRADWFTDSVPISFADPDVAARTADGVPVEGESYLSDNMRVAPSAGRP